MNGARGNLISVLHNPPKSPADGSSSECPEPGSDRYGESVWFHHVHLAQLKLAAERRAAHIVINAFELAQAVSRYYSGTDLEHCNELMRKEMKAGDEIVKGDLQRGLLCRAPANLRALLAASTTLG